MPIKRHKHGLTNAMILALNGIIPSKEWLHDPNLCSYSGCTVAHIFAL